MTEKRNGEDHDLVSDENTKMVKQQIDDHSI